MPNAQTAPSPASPDTRPTRPRKAHNLYLDESLVKWAKGFAPSTVHKSLSGLVESLLAEHIAKVKAGETLPSPATSA